MTAPAVLTAAELRGLLDSPASPRIIDVRTPGEFETVHIAGAYNVPLDLLREHRDEIRAHLDEHVVHSGQRAAPCLMGMLLAKLPYNRGPSCDAESVVAQLLNARSDTRSAGRR